MPKFTPSAGDETSKAAARRRASGWFDPPSGYLVGTKGIDIGAGHTPVVDGCKAWDLANGDTNAELLEGVEDASMDWAYSSHLLEHAERPGLSLSNWWRVVKPGGYLVLSVPEEDSYECGFWPSLNNSDHRSSFALAKDGSWGPSSRNLLDLLSHLPYHKLILAQSVQDGPDYASLEIIVQKDPEQPAWVNTVISKVSCPCGSQQLLLEGVNLAAKIVLVCVVCGQRVNHELKTFTNNALHNQEINIRKLQAASENMSAPGSTSLSEV